MEKLRTSSSFVVAGLVFLSILFLDGYASPSSALNRVIIGIPNDIKNYHPVWEADTRDRAIRENIYDPLVMRDYDGKIIPGLAESWTLLNPTNLEFKLRKGVKFHNGEPFNAQVAKYSIDIARNHKLSMQRTFVAPVDDVQVIDDYTLRLKLKAPAPDLLEDLPWILMVPKKLAEEKGLEYFNDHAVGTGAFQLAEWKKDEFSRMVANPNWWRGKPKIDEIVYRPLPDSSSRVASLLVGEVDIIEDVPPEDIDRIQKTGKTRVLRVPGSRRMSLYLDTFNKMGGKLGQGSPGIPEGKPNPFSEVKVRMAVAYAIDKDIIVKQVLNGLTERADQLMLRNSPYYHPKLKAIPYDPAKAKALLKEAGYPDGFSFRLDIGQEWCIRGEEIATVIADQLSKVGIKAELNSLKYSVFNTKVRNLDTSACFYGSKSMHLTGLGMSLLTPDPATGLGRGNYSNYRDKKMDTLMNQLITTSDGKKRKEYAFQLAEYFDQQMPFVLLYWEPYIIGISNKFESPLSFDYQLRAFDIVPR